MKRLILIVFGFLLCWGSLGSSAASAWNSADHLTNMRHSSSNPVVRAKSFMPQASLYQSSLVTQPRYSVSRQASEVEGFLLGLELVLYLGPGLADVVGLGLNIFAAFLPSKSHRLRLLFGITGITVAVLTALISVIIMTQRPFDVVDGIFMGVRAAELGLGIMNVVISELQTSGRRVAFLPWFRGEQDGGIAGGLAAIGRF